MNATHPGDWQIDLDEVAASAAIAQLDAETTAVVLALAAKVAASPLLHATTRRLRAVLLERAPRDAIAEVAAMNLDSMGAEAFVYYLLLALLELPAARARHAAQDIDPRISQDTWRDLALWGVWAREFDLFGIPLEVLDWTQHYLRSNLMRFGPIELELCAFNGPLVGYKHRETNELRALTLPGTTFHHGGRSVTPGASGGDVLVAGGSLEGPRPCGHPIDGVSGAVLPDMVTLDAAQWEPWITPGTPMLEQHTPADTRLSLPDFLRAGRQAFAVFAALWPNVAPRGVFGEAWLLDPQLQQMMPRNARLAEFRGASLLYPSRIPEAKTIRRIFGPGATREAVVAAPRNPTNFLQRKVADFLAVEDNHLCAAGGLILRERIDALLASTEAEGR